MQGVSLAGPADDDLDQGTASSTLDSHAPNLLQRLWGAQSLFFWRAFPCGLPSRTGCGVCIDITAIGGILWSMAHDKHRDAGFVGTHTSIGTVTVVDVPPVAANSSSLVVLLLDANLPDGTVLHRRLQMMRCTEPFSWIGRQVHFQPPHARLPEPR
ncbi:hypothetical protein [Rhodococcus erythropolis]|uniref:hypothetical protein n=1 Tax=Rhodococcus erythropolis TaxID=1833 RepID=UPI000878A69F|nr:hypothetical protein [Rhodococcus erythropolis]OFV76949.1 hypothetical protein RERY_24000 [Rhodococcus erythropolis]